RPKWTAAHAEQLRGASAAIVWADNDSPGEAHARAVADSLRGIGVADVRIVRFGDEQPGYDVADWVAARKRTNRTTQQVKAELRALVNAAGRWTESTAARNDATAVKKPAQRERAQQGRSLDLSDPEPWP